jgi:hypothetical protein
MIGQIICVCDKYPVELDDRVKGKNMASSEDDVLDDCLFF